MRGRFTLNNVWQAAAVIAVGPCSMLVGGFGCIMLVVWTAYVETSAIFHEKLHNICTHTHIAISSYHRSINPHITHIHCEQNMVAKKHYQIATGYLFPHQSPPLEEIT